MVRYMEVWSYVDDFNVLHWKEEWEPVDDVKFICLNCEAKFRTNASFKFHCGMTHGPTGLDFSSFCYTNVYKIHTNTNKYI